jgi:alkylhydroperoxidase/carboxymuconolactone decarboxylase family protein YurZ
MSRDTEQPLTAAEARSRILGAQKVAPELRTATLSSPLIDWSADAVWGVWARRGLDLKQRSLVVCTTLAVLGRLDKLEIHLMGALRQGWTPDELAEAMLQMTAYAGVAVGTDAYAALAKAAAQWEQETAKPARTGSE